MKIISPDLRFNPIGPFPDADKHRRLFLSKFLCQVRQLFENRVCRLVVSLYFQSVRGGQFFFPPRSMMISSCRRATRFKISPNFCRASTADTDLLMNGTSNTITIIMISMIILIIVPKYCNIFIWIYHPVIRPEPDFSGLNPGPLTSVLGPLPHALCTLPILFRVGRGLPRL